MAEGGAGDEDGDEEHVAGQGPSAMEEDECCWICLEAGSRHDLVNPCRCPRKCHPQCMARWQLQQAGRAEETHCRFCNSALADWKASLTPETLKPEVEKVQPVMVVYFEGEIHRIPVRQGKEGLDVFTDRIRELFRLPEDVDISLTFGCKEPMSGQHLKLEGIGAFDAAVHCASVAAAERQHKIRSNGGGSSGAAGGSSAAGAEAAGGPSSSGSPNSSSAGDCSAGGNVLGGSAPVTSTSSPTASRGGNHVGTTPLRHSTGSTPWVPAGGSSSTAAASTGLGAVAGASRLLRAVGPDLMEQDDDDGGDTPSPFMQGVPAWQGAYPPRWGRRRPRCRPPRRCRCRCVPTSVRCCSSTCCPTRPPPRPSPTTQPSCTTTTFLTCTPTHATPLTATTATLSTPRPSLSPPCTAWHRCPPRPPPPTCWRPARPALAARPACGSPLPCPRCR